MKYDVITIGSAVLDIYLMSDGYKKLETDMYEGGEALCQEYGGKLEVSDVELTTGGAGTNNAVSYARKDLKTAVVCEMGKDIIARTILAELEREKVSCEFVVQEFNEETGLSSIMVAGDGGRAIAVYRGASKMLTVEDMPWAKLESEWMHVSSLGGRVELVEALLNFARDKGIKVAWNPGKSECEAMKEKDDRVEWLSKVEVLIVNREESEFLTGVDYTQDELWQKSEGIEGPKIVVMTDGKDGGKVFVDGRKIEYEALSSEVVEVTGAGDSFGSGLVAGLIKGKAIEEAIEWGKRQAASVVSKMGPKRGLLTLEQIANGR